MSLVVLALGALAITLGLVVVWQTRQLRLPTKGAITFFVASSVSAWLFFRLQPPTEWPPIDLQITKVTPEGDSQTIVRGLVNEGPFPTQIEVTVPAYTEIPKIGQNLRLYQNPENKVQISTLPEVTDVEFDHLGLAALAGLATIGGIGCTIFSWLHRDYGLAARSFSRPGASPIWQSVYSESPAAAASTTSPTPTVKILREIDWYQFEKLMERLLQLEGYHVIRSGGAKADSGIDILAERDGRKTVIQCKHWNSPVKPATIREAIGIRNIHQADEMVLATLSSGTPAALELARQQRIRVTNEGEIFARLERVGLDKFAALLDPNDKCCPRCDAPMVLRTGGRKPFWGCANYGTLRCTGTIEA